MRFTIVTEWICISFVQQGEGIAEAVTSQNKLNKKISSGGRDVSFTSIGVFDSGPSHLFK